MSENMDSGNSDLEQLQRIADDLYQHIDPLFNVYEMSYEAGSLYFYGIPRADAKTIQKDLWTVFSQKGYQFSMGSQMGEDVIIASPAVEVKERYWLNGLLAILTFFTTMVAGAGMFGVDVVSDPVNVVKGLPFTLAIMAVLGSHEMGHYVVAKMHGMKTSLPYFIPFPTFIGTMGAIIKHRGPIPDRKSLFDVGVAGPLAGLVVSVAVTLIGLSLPPVTYAAQTSMIEFQEPILFSFLMGIMGHVGENVHPVAFAGWVGMFVTVLNLIPSGQLDGGHALRAMLGRRARFVSSLTPFALLVLGIYVSRVMGQNGFVWIFWALFLSFFAAAGHPDPLDDDVKLDKGRIAVGVFTFVLGILCFTLVPFTFVE